MADKVTVFHPDVRPWPACVHPWPTPNGLTPRDTSWGYIGHHTMIGAHVHAGDTITEHDDGSVTVERRKAR